VLALYFGLGLVIILLVNALINQLVWWIPPSVEKQLGLVAVPLFETQSQSSPTQTELNHLLDRLKIHLPEPVQSGHNYQVLYIPQPTVNALAIPGDRIIIYQGLLAQMDSENELMMVLGHELGHFAHRDHLRSLGRGILLRLVWSYFFGDVGSLGSTLISGVETFSNAHYSRAQESQADQLGLELLVKTYGHAAGAADFFEELSKKSNANLDFLATHPAPQKRVKQLQQLIDKNGYPIGQVSPLSTVLTQ
jgi:Zn-dependent protease with chaperone function